MMLADGNVTEPATGQWLPGWAWIAGRFAALMRPAKTKFASSTLSTALAVAVPLWIEQFKQQPWPTVLAHTVGLADLISSESDTLLYGGKHGQAAELFNRLARGVAAMSFCKGGVEIFGQRFEAQHAGVQA